MRKHLLVCLLAVMCIVCVTGCWSYDDGSNFPNPSSTEASNDGQTGIAGWGPHIFSELSYSDDKQADRLLEALIAAIENRDSQAIRGLFSPKAILEADNIDEQIGQLLDLLQDDVVSFERYGPITSEKKNSTAHTKILEISCDIISANGKYRLAIKVCTVDSSEPDNVGISSVYVIKAETNNTNSVYWGDGEWRPGIINGEDEG